MVNIYPHGYPRLVTLVTFWHTCCHILLWIGVHIVYIIYLSLVHILSSCLQPYHSDSHILFGWYIICWVITYHKVLPSSILWKLFGFMPPFT
jgi:hypothetical protein